VSVTQIPGYTSMSTVKEDPTYPGPQSIPANTWVDLDLGDVPTFEGPDGINAQVYFELVTGTKLAVRTKRKAGDFTGQHNYLVKGPTWAISYFDLDYCKAPNLTRGIQVWADKACVVQSRIVKVIRPLLIDGSTT
jgi:hypothetical protein